MARFAVNAPWRVIVVVEALQVPRDSCIVCGALCHCVSVQPTTRTAREIQVASCFSSVPPWAMSPARLARLQRCMMGGKAAQGFCKAGPSTPKPIYSDDSLFDRTAISVFRGALAQTLGGDTSSKEGYAGIMELALELNRQYTSAETRMRTRGVLRGLFPKFIIMLFPLMFARPFPAFSAKLNAWITSLTCVWLMGPNTLFDVEADELTSPVWGDGKGQVLDCV